MMYSISPTSFLTLLVGSNSHSSSPSDSARGGSSDDVNGYCKIFVGGLHYDTRDADFRGYFERFGRVQSAEVMFNRETHKSRGFGFIIFEMEDSIDAVEAISEHVIDAKVVRHISIRALCLALG